MRRRDEESGAAAPLSFMQPVFLCREVARGRSVIIRATKVRYLCAPSRLRSRFSDNLEKQS
jgi:hypothetical protein